MLIVLVLFLTVLLRFGLVLTAIYLFLPRAPACPRCGADLSRVRHPVLARVLPAIEHRWCLDCGWTGLVRRAPHSRVMSRTARS